MNNYLLISFICAIETFVSGLLFSLVANGNQILELSEFVSLSCIFLFAVLTLVFGVEVK